MSDCQAKSLKIEEAPQSRLSAIGDTSIFCYFACTANPLIILSREVGEGFSLTNLLGAANEANVLVFCFRVLRGLSPKSPKALKNYRIAFSTLHLESVAVGLFYSAFGFLASGARRCEGSLPEGLKQLRLFAIGSVRSIEPVPKATHNILNKIEFAFGAKQAVGLFYSAFGFLASGARRCEGSLPEGLKQLRLFAIGSVRSIEPVPKATHSFKRIIFRKIFVELGFY